MDYGPSTMDKKSKESIVNSPWTMARLSFILKNSFYGLWTIDYGQKTMNHKSKRVHSQ